VIGRVEVSGESMLPTYGPGDWLVVWWHRRARRPLPRPGSVVVVRRPERLIVKRVERRLADGTVWILGDNPEGSDDSRSFGAVAANDVVGRVLCRYRRSSS
jgi:nickel-type superoxide dismutase maturation protease